ncbi:glycosyltransferase family 4 protein [Alteribacillus sp. HJP-4]|uniref:glycosyltransferase family 4 protein n=1 Tax=Alteribacillus sp. HJP-4 TaxID=2775394 RepID=UPI0035CCDD03
MKNVWIVAPFANIDDVGDANRFQYLANRLHEEGANVTLFTSNFAHMEKEHINEDIAEAYPYQVICVKEPGYQKNVSMKRAWSHTSFSRQLKKVMSSMDKPDVVYAAYPTMTAAYAAGKYAKKHHLPFIIDIQDTWPESISSAINTERFYIKLLMWPFSKFADHIYRMADVVFAVSETYAQRANVKGTKCIDFIPVYIGAEAERFEQPDEEPVVKRDDEIWITYIGTLSHSYDMETAIKTFASMKEHRSIKLNILGSGPDEEKLIQLAKKLDAFDVNVHFYGYIPYEKMAAILKKSDIALNAIKGSAKQTVTNKLGDYLSAGLPILNSCQEKEIMGLVQEKELGLNYIPGDPEVLRERLLQMIEDRDKLLQYSHNSLVFAKERFNRKESYSSIVEKIHVI